MNAPVTDRVMIEEVIARDTAAYLARDLDTWRSCWVRAPRLTSIMECGGLIVSRGYDAFETTIRGAMEKVPAPSRAEVERQNLAIEIDGDTAWAAFDQIVTDPSDPLDPPSVSYNLRILERGADGWKIVFHGVWGQRGHDAEGPVVEVDADARILWMNAAAARALPGFPGLTQSHGVLRASRPATDREFRAAIARAAELLDFVTYRSVMGLTGDAVEFPVILGEDDDARLLIAWVRVFDFRLYVSFGDDARLTRQIAKARIVFGLSEAQSVLLSHIADGATLTEAAEHMGVAPSTARTHLDRMFDRTGVRSQTALLRIVLSGG